MSMRKAPAADIPDMGGDVQMVDIEQPHNHDVLCGRGVTTNRFPGNESFRSLVSLNKELYVTSTKRQKMSISRSIVEAVRSLKPPGRFLEKNPVTGRWSDIGDRKAIEKTSQALRDGAAGLRKELSEDLGDPEFLSGLFDAEANAAKSAIKPSSSSLTLKDKMKPVKPKAVKKGHRRTRSNPSPVASSKATIKATLRKQKSQAGSPASPASKRASSLPPKPPLSPVSPHSSAESPSSGWSRYPSSRGHHGPYPPEGPPHPGVRYAPGNAYHAHHAHHPFMTPPHHHPRPPHPPHSWHGGPPRYPGPGSAPPSVVHTPNSPLPPGCHQLSPSGCISKPPLSPMVARWSPRHFPPHSYPPHPDYYRPDYAPTLSGHPDYRWPPTSRDYNYYRNQEFFRSERDDRSLDVPDLGRDRSYRGSSSRDDRQSLPPQEFTPPTTPSGRRKSDNMPPSSTSSPQKTPELKKERGDRWMVAPSQDKSYGTGSEAVKEFSERIRNSTEYEKLRSKDDSTQKTAMSPVSVTESDKDVEMEDCRSPEQHIINGEIHIISVVHKMNDKMGEREESIEFMLKDPTGDDYSLSPLPYEQEDPSTLMELPDDILHMPISACGPHDD